MNYGCRHLARPPLELLPFVAMLVVLPFPGTVAMRLLCLFLAFGVALILARHDKELWRCFPPARLYLALWVLVCGLSLSYSVDPAHTLKELQNEIVYAMVAYYAFYVIGQQRHRALVLLRSLALGLLLIGGIAICNWCKNDLVWQESGMQGGVGSFSTYIVTCIPALFWLSVEESDFFWCWLGRILILFALALAFLTLQRAVWPALAAELLIALYLLCRIGRLRIKKEALLGFMILLLAACAFVFAQSNKMRGMSSIANLIPSTQAMNTSMDQLDGTNGDVRLSYWPLVIETITDHPLIGTGFGLGLMKKAYPEMVPANFTALWHAHNTVLNYAIQMGVPGALVLLMLFLGLARDFWRRLQHDPAIAIAAIAGIMLLAGVLLRNQTNDFFRRDLALLFWSLVGLFSALSHPRVSTK